MRAVKLFGFGIGILILWVIFNGGIRGLMHPGVNFDSPAAFPQLATPQPKKLTQSQEAAWNVCNARSIHAVGVGLEPPVIGSRRFQVTSISTGAAEGRLQFDTFAINGKKEYAIVCKVKGKGLNWDVYDFDYF